MISRYFLVNFKNAFKLTNIDNYDFFSVGVGVQQLYAKICTISVTLVTLLHAAKFHDKYKKFATIGSYATAEQQ